MMKTATQQIERDRIYRVEKKRRRFKPYPKGCGDIKIMNGQGVVKEVVKVHDVVFKKWKPKLRIKPKCGADMPGAPVGMAGVGKSMRNGQNQDSFTAPRGISRYRRSPYFRSEILRGEGLDKRLGRKT